MLISVLTAWKTSLALRFQLASKRRKGQAKRHGIAPSAIADFSVEILEDRTLLSSISTSAEFLAPGNILVSPNVDMTSGHRPFYEYTSSGERVHSYSVPSVNTSSTEYLRDLTVDRTGRVQIFNGTFAPVLTTFDPAIPETQHHEAAGWSTVNNLTYGNLAAFKQYVFVTDMSTYRGEERGLIRFNTHDFSWTRFADRIEFTDVTLGQDGLLYGLEGSYSPTIHVFDPQTLEPIRMFRPQSSEGLRGIDVNADGDVFSSTWDGNIYRFDSQGSPVARIYTGVSNLSDLDLHPDGRIIVGSRFGDVLLTDESLSQVTSFDTGSASIFVAFTDANRQLEIVTNSEEPMSFLPGDSPKPIDESLKLFGPSDAQLDGATVQITAGLADGDILGFESQSGITGAYDAVSGTLTLQGTAPLEDYRAALRSVTYYNGSESLSGSRTVTFTIQGTNTASASRDIIFEPFNHTPVARDQAFEMDEDGALNGSIVAFDEDGDELTYQVADNPAHGTLSFQSDGSFTYEPEENFHGTDVFTFQASDGEKTSDAAEVTITIHSINDAPVVSSDQYSVKKGGTLLIAAAGFNRLVMDSESGDYIGQGRTYDLRDDDVDFSVGRNYRNGVSAYLRGDSWWGLNFAAPFSLELERGTYPGATRFPFQDTWEPGLSVYGEGRGCNRLTGEFTVHQANYDTDGSVLNFLADFEQHCEGGDPALFGTLEFNAAPNSNAGVLANDHDPEDDPMTAILVGNPSHGVLSFHANGTFEYTPAPDFSGTDSFTYRVSDGTQTSEPVTVTITVDPQNGPPIIEDQSVGVNEDGLLRNRLDSNDPDGDELNFSVVEGPAHGRFFITSSGAFAYQPAPNFHGTDRVQIQASDGALESEVATLSITVNPVNDRPVVSHQSESIEEDTKLHAAVTGTDVDGDELTFSVYREPEFGSLEFQSDGSYTYTPNENFNGLDSFYVRAFDGTAYSNLGRVTIHIAAVDDPPIAVDDQYQTDEDQPLQLIASGLTRLVMDSESGDYIGQGQTYDYGTADGRFFTRRNGYNGVSAYFRGYQRGDWWNLSFAAPYSQELVPGFYPGATRYPFQDAAEPGLSVSGQGRGCNRLTGEFTVHQANYDTDGSVLNFLADFEQHCEGGDPALFGTLEYNAAPNPNAGVLGNDIEVDGDPLTAILVEGPAHGTLEFHSDGTFTYTPDPNFHGTDTFSYRTSDSHTESETATVTITTNPVNDPPVAEDDHYRVLEDRELLVSTPGTLTNDHDVDGDALTATLIDGPSHGTLRWNEDGSFSYQPAPEYFGPDSFTYQANDGRTTSEPATVFITVDPVEDVLIDIKPGDEANRIDRDNSGAIPVAVLSTADFSAPKRINADSLTFGRTGDEDSLMRIGPEQTPLLSVYDVNRDGFNDLVAHFEVQQAGFQEGDREGILRGELVDGMPLEGRQPIEVISSQQDGGAPAYSTTSSQATPSKSTDSRTDPFRRGNPTLVGQSTRPTKGYAAAPETSSQNVPTPMTFAEWSMEPSEMLDSAALDPLGVDQLFRESWVSNQLLRT